jgi:hypothetical protein
MAAMLPTIDIEPVYDESVGGIFMRCVVKGIAFCALGMTAMGVLGQTNVPMQPAANGGPTGAPAAPMQDGMTKGIAARGPLKVSFGTQSAEWTPESLAKLPHISLSVYNEHSKANETYSGVALIDLLKPLGVPDKPHGKEFRLYLVAEGSDGYQVVYSMAEVTPDVHDGTVIVADAEDGKPLDKDGPLKLVAAGEKRPARWVRNLVAVRVLPAQ